VESRNKHSTPMYVIIHW